MEFAIRCPHCGGRTTAQPRQDEQPGFVICPYCQQPIPLQGGADDEPPAPAD